MSHGSDTGNEQGDRGRDAGTAPFAEVLADHGTASRADLNSNGELPVRDHPTVRAVLGDVVASFQTESEDESFVPTPSASYVAEQFFDFGYLDRYEEVDRTWVDRPYAYTSILYDETDNEYVYHVSEPVLDEFEQYVREDLVELLRDNLLYHSFEDEAERETVFRREAERLITDHAATVDSGSLHKLLYYLLRGFIHYGPIDPLMRDPAIEDISCDGADVPIFVYHRTYRDLVTNVAFERDRLDPFTFRLAQRAGKQLTVSDPLVDASLPDGSRVQLTLGGDVSTRGSNFTIRKFADVPFTPVDLVASGTFSAAQMAYFWLVIANNKSLIFAGGTGSGKTSSMNAVSFFVPPRSKVVSIEDTREIDLPHDNWIQSVTRDGVSADGRGEVSMYRLLQAALRQRPEYLLVGEIRTEERVALAFFQAMSTGHTAYTTMHADSVETALSRLRNPPLNVPEQMLQDLDVISVQAQTFLGDDRVRRNRTVAEISAGEYGSGVETKRIFERDAATDTHEQVGDSVVLQEIAHDRGWDDTRLERELRERERVIQYLIDAGMTDYGDVARTIKMYHRNPDRLMERIRAETLTREDLPDRRPAVTDIGPSDISGAEDLIEDS
ncbi:type II/IV secretion system ATPase subunit [Halorientalis salina]|uniref:type II/IV secretion system ATPase subunit n=1 Tax=Halorientalis salina TaxID=2932266 RepID=UPI0010ACECAC|nr:type II/IV secretion system ATPase subunit [Halorientalis salina]